jgi:hypothetical protein
MFSTEFFQHVFNIFSNFNKFFQYFSYKYIIFLSTGCRRYYFFQKKSWKYCLQSLVHTKVINPLLKKKLKIDAQLKIAEDIDAQLQGSVRAKGLEREEGSKKAKGKRKAVPS